MKRTSKAKKATASTKKKVKRVSKSTASTKKEKINKLSFADGKLDVDKTRELEELLGINQMNVFKTNDIEVFKENLSEMSLTEMQTLAAEIGVFPGGNKMAIKNRLIKEFLSETKGRRYAFGDQIPLVDPEDPKYDEIKRLMTEGL